MVLIVPFDKLLVTVPLKICLVILSIVNNNNNLIAVVKAVNALMKVIHGIEVYSNKVIIAPRKSKQPNL